MSLTGIIFSICSRDSLIHVKREWCISYLSRCRWSEVPNEKEWKDLSNSVVGQGMVVDTGRNSPAVRVSRGSVAASSGAPGEKPGAAKPRPEAYELVASVESFDTAYHLLSMETENGLGGGFQDEAFINIFAKVQSIGPKHRHLIGRNLNINLICDRRYGRGASSSTPTETPLLLSLNFNKADCTACAYLPTHPFWALRSALAMGAIDRIELTYRKWPYYRSARVEALCFEPVLREAA